MGSFRYVVYLHPFHFHLVDQQGLGFHLHQLYREDHHLRELLVDLHLPIIVSVCVWGGGGGGSIHIQTTNFHICTSRMFNNFLLSLSLSPLSSLSLSLPLSLPISLPLSLSLSLSLSPSLSLSLSLSPFPPHFTGNPLGP